MVSLAYEFGFGFQQLFEFGIGTIHKPFIFGNVHHIILRQCDLCSCHLAKTVVLAKIGHKSEVITGLLGVLACGSGCCFQILKLLIETNFIFHLITVYWCEWGPVI